MCWLGRAQVNLRHTKGLPYRCFLPDLTRFSSSRCTGPGLIPANNVKRVWRREWDSNPRYQSPGTHAFQACSLSHSDISPCHTTPTAIEPVYESRSQWRREWDSNPRSGFAGQRFSRPPHSTALPSLRETPEFRTDRTEPGGSFKERNRVTVHPGYPRRFADSAQSQTESAITNFLRAEPLEKPAKHLPRFLGPDSSAQLHLVIEPRVIDEITE